MYFRVHSFPGALMPSVRQRRSLARTAMYGSTVCTNMAVSKPSRGTDPRASSRPGRGPAKPPRSDPHVRPKSAAGTVGRGGQPVHLRADAVGLDRRTHQLPGVDGLRAVQRRSSLEARANRSISAHGALQRVAEGQIFCNPRGQQSAFSVLFWLTAEG